MRFCLPWALLLAACGSSPSGPSAPEGAPFPRTRVYFRQYYGGSHVFAIENLAGRREVDLRSRTRQPGEPAVAFVPDEVMEKMLSEFKRFGYFKHAGPRPADPGKLGGRAELTIVEESGKTTALIRRHGQGKSAFEAYRGSMDTFLAVHDFYGRFQATTSTGGDFGVRKAEFRGK